MTGGHPKADTRNVRNEKIRRLHLPAVLGRLRPGTEVISASSE